MAHRRASLVIALAVVLGASLLSIQPGLAQPTASHRGGILRGDLGPARGEPLAVARRALARHAAELGIDAGAFRFETVRRSIVGVHVRGREYRGGVPVETSSAAVHWVDGRIWQVEATPSPLPGRAAVRTITASVARAAALRHLGTANPFVPPHAERLLTPVGGRLVDAWRVDVLSLAPAVAGTVVVDSATGRVLEVRDRRRFEDGTGTVFDPNPIVTAKDASLRQPGPDEAGVDLDLDSPEQTAQLVGLPVLGYDPAALALGRLTGPWADVQGPLPHVPGGSFDYTKMDPRFESVMAYAHIDRLQRYFQSLGFIGAAGVNAEPQLTIAVIVPTYDQSFYQPGNDLMLFGSGGVDDAEDAEIIVHEYGHAVHDSQVPGWGETHEGGSMGEGFGDFLAAAYYAIGSEGFQDQCVGDWDATSYADAAAGEGPCLRRTDSGKTYPDGMEDEVHADGEIWSEFLWDLRDRLGCVPKEKRCARRSAATVASIKTRRVLTLLLTSHELLTPQADFGDALAALVTAAKALKQPRWVPLIVKAARARGLPLS